MAEQLEIVAPASAKLTSTTANPYVGPRTFTDQQAHLFFGREQEARELLALVIAERLVLFYAQSGAGKSSLLNARLIPQLRTAKYLMLPVARVGGELPAGIAAVENIYVFNLLLNLNQRTDNLATFAQMSLSDFMAGLRTPDGQHYFYDAEVAARAAARAMRGEAVTPQPPHVLVIDQFEELVATHPTHWREREDFFRQLNDAMQNDPYLWVVLTLREDFVAALDPYARLVPGNMRTRYYMQRMGVAAALEAVRRPAERAGRPFDAGVAEAMVDNLRRVKMLGQEQDQLGQYVEPVQLQVVCYQLWERLQGRPPGPITAEDVQESGDVDSALADFYDEAVATVFAEGDPAVAEWQLRDWFDKELITEVGTRGTVFQGPQETADMPNAVVARLSQRFLLRTELRAGGAWIELMHDRFVQPILKANQRWLERQSPLLRAARDWEHSDRNPALLYLGQQLKDALNALPYNQHEPVVLTFLAASKAQADAQRAHIWKDEPPGDRRPDGFTRSLALVIGIDDYSNGLPKLTTAVNDARRLATLLHTEHGYYVHQLVEEVTRIQLEEFLTQTLPQKVNEHDRLLIYFAGHGIAQESDHGADGYLLPQDARPESTATYLALSDLFGWLNQLTCRHLFVLLDCAFAGEFRWAGLRSAAPAPDLLYREQYDRLVRNPAWQLLISTSTLPLAELGAGYRLGDRHEQGDHSAFAQALLQGLHGDADQAPSDGVITASELFRAVQASDRDGDESGGVDSQRAWLWTLRNHAKGDYLFQTPGRELNLPPARQLTEQNNPYRGLEAYEEKDADLFFGRATLVQELATRVMQRSLTVVLGASGAGKSSLVKAGLAPYLRKLSAGRQRDLVRILSPIRPADAPLRVLIRLLRGELYGEDLRRPEPPNLDPEQVAANSFAIIQHWIERNPKRKLLLVVDQLEELVTSSRDLHESEQFIILIGRLLDEYAAQLHVVFTLRSDFEPQFAITPLAGAIRQRWIDARFLVRPMSPTELREAVEGPAAGSVLEFDPPSLIDELVNEVLYTPGALSMLSFTLSELYLMYLGRQAAARSHGRKIERTLTGADYRALGGVNGSLRKRATEVYEQLDDAHQATLQRIMLRMVAVEGNELARRRVPRTELVYPNAEENQRVATVLEQLAAAQLVVEGSDDAGVAYVEPVHDALVRAWDKLLVWKREAEEILPLQRRLILAANEWQRAVDKSKRSLLWNNDPRLSQLQQVLTLGASSKRRTGLLTSARQTLWPSSAVTREPTWLNKVETDFVEQSVARRSSLSRRIAGLTLAVLLALMSLSLFAEIQRRSAAVERDIAFDARETAQAEASRASEARVMAEEQSAEAKRQAHLAGQAEATAQTARVAAETRLVAALNLGNGLADLLTRQAPTATPTPGAISTGGVLLPTPTFTPGDTPTPDAAATATTEALQAQLEQLQGTATAAAEATQQASTGQTAPVQQSIGELAYTETEINLRAEPSADSDSVDVLPAGTEVIIEDEEGDWYLVATLDQSGPIGYVNRADITFTAPVEPSPTETPTPTPTETVVEEQAASQAVQGPIRSTSLRGELPPGGMHYLSLEPNTPDARVELRLGFDLPISSESSNRLNFWVLDAEGLKQYQSGTNPAEIAIAAGSSIYSDAPWLLGATIQGSGPFTVIVYNNANIDGSYSLSVTGGILGDDAGQTLP